MNSPAFAMTQMAPAQVQQPMQQIQNGMSFPDFVRAYMSDPGSLGQGLTGNPTQDVMAVMQNRGFNQNQLDQLRRSYPGAR